MKETHLRAYGKINLGLDVIRKRPDGYHDLDMIMQTVGIYDDVVIKTTGRKGEIKVETDATVLPNDEGNLAYRAAKLLLDEFDIDDGVCIYINKVIPIAGGMAGGSSDCAATLKGINELFGLGLDEEALKKRGVTLGADVPYCIMGGTALARGIGDKLTRLPAPPDCTVVIAKPPISISTAYIYGNIRPDRLNKHPDIDRIVKCIEQGDLAGMAKLLYNVMEEVTAKENPIIREIENIMIDCGALNSIMSGSGPTVFGLFDDEEKAVQAEAKLKQRSLTEQLYITHFVN
ncbi:MAG: 4-(cytidine 5'-diphospho)-2-C-methyl-D-erythritol kinase [Lachnospiraceae bacterium]|nr:4-(cytidine 5'-diphospho)-2-C-methyl-D-erythritol kinase [Lachnospiraceae bacterium]